MTPEEVERIGNQWLKNIGADDTYWANPRGTYKKYAIASVLYKNRNRKYMGLPWLLAITPSGECYELDRSITLDVLDGVDLYEDRRK